MPYPNEHAARFKSPTGYDSYARVNDKFGAGIDAIFGIKNGKSELQAIRFDSGKFSVDEAKSWLKAHEKAHGKPISFEPASGKVKKRIEDLEVPDVFCMSDNDLYAARSKCLHLWKCMNSGLRPAIARDVLVSKYESISAVLKSRKLRCNLNELDRFLMCQKMFNGLDPASLDEIVLESNYVAMGGEFVSNPKKAATASILVKDGEVAKSYSLESSIATAVHKQLCDILKFDYTPVPSGTFIGLYDLVLRPRTSIEKLHIEAPKVTKEDTVKTQFKIIKLDKAEQIVGGIVYEPGVIDAQNDWTDEVEIRKAMYKFMENSPRIDFMHGGESSRVDARILENYQMPCDIELDVANGKQKVAKGTWWLTVRVRDKDIWKMIESGEITGFSMGGSAYGI